MHTRRTPLWNSIDWFHAWNTIYIITNQIDVINLPHHMYLTVWSVDHFHLKWNPNRSSSSYFRCWCTAWINISKINAKEITEREEKSIANVLVIIIILYSYMDIFYLYTIYTAQLISTNQFLALPYTSRCVFVCLLFFVSRLLRSLLLDCAKTNSVNFDR